MTDQLNWKHHAPSHSEKPQVLIDLESIIQSHSPTWVDCQKLLFTLFYTEEHQQIVREARKWCEANRRGGLSTGSLNERKPCWDPSIHGVRNHVERYKTP